MSKQQYYKILRELIRRPREKDKLEDKVSTNIDLLLKKAIRAGHVEEIENGSLIGMYKITELGKIDLKSFNQNQKNV